jgi:hypothetical protein
MKSVRLLKLDWNLLVGVLGCSERCPHFRWINMNTLNITGVDLNFCCRTSSVMGWNAFSTGMSLGPTVDRQWADSGPTVGQQWADSETALFFLKLFIWTWPFMITYCKVFTARFLACLFLHAPNVSSIKKTRITTLICKYILHTLLILIFFLKHEI